MRPLRALGLLLLTLSAYSSSQNTQQANANSSDSVPQFHARSELVFVPVVVRKHGAHVQGLTKDSFRVEQDGKPQEIAVLEEVGDAAPVAAEPPAPASPDLITNYSVVDQHPRRVLIVVLDMVNTPHRNQKRAKDALIKFLATSVPKDEPVALLAFGRAGLTQLHSFTTDTGVLVAALQKCQARLGVADTLATPIEESGIADTLESQETQRLTQWVQDSLAIENSFMYKNAISLTLAAMQQVAGAFSGVPGRKALLWATDGFPFLLQDPLSLTGVSTEMLEQYQSTWRLLSAADIAVYPIGLEGLVPDLAFDASRKSLPISARRPSLNRSIPYDPQRQRQDTMRSFADNTGGRAYLNNNDALNGFKEAALDSHSYYLLGYYLRGETKAGWHKLKVHVNSPHSDVRAREGFFFANQADLPKLKRKEFVIALGSPIDYTGIHFALKLDPIPDPDPSAPAKKRSVTMKLMVPMNGITISQSDNAFDLDLAAVALRKDGEAAGDAGGTLHATVKPDSLQKLLKTGIVLKAAVQVPPGEYDLRVGVRDNANGSIGTLRTHITVK